MDHTSIEVSEISWFGSDADASCKRLDDGGCVGMVKIKKKMMNKAKEEDVETLPGVRMTCGSAPLF